MARLTACSTLAFSLSSIETAFKHISAYGFKSVEISDQVTHSKHFPIDSVDPHHVRHLLEKYNLSPIASNTGLCFINNGEWEFKKLPRQTQSAAEISEIIEAKQKLVFHILNIPEQAEHYKNRVRTLIDKAEIAGIPKVSLQAGRRIQADKSNAELKTAAGIIDTLAEYAQKKGIKLLLEIPHVWNLCFNMDRSKQMLDYLKSNNVGVTVDTTHWHTSNYNLDEYFSFLGNRLWHAHIRDAAGKDNSSGNYELEKTPGKGEINFVEFGEALDKYGYRGEITLETEYKNYKDESFVDTENLFAIEHLKKCGFEVP